MSEPWKGVRALIDGEGRVKEFSRGRTLLLHNDFRKEVGPYRFIEGEPAEAMYRAYLVRRSKRFTEMLSEPEYAEQAQRTIARMKERGTWIEPDAPAPSAGAGADGGARTMSRWYQLKDGQPVPVAPYTPNILQDVETRTVARDTFPDGSDEIVVSTVFLGLDHGWGDGPPVLWETMIFWTGNHELDDQQWRYTSEAEARKGHAEAVELVKQALRQPPAPTEECGR